MSSLIRLELRKALANRWFFISLGLALALALASAFISAEAALSWAALKDGGSQEYLVMTTQGSYGNSLFVGEDVAKEAFFLLAPLLALTPYAWSLRSEMVSGFLAHMYTRCPRSRYLAAKATATFTTGFLVAAIPLMVNFIALSCLLPAYQPEVYDNLYLGVNPEDAFARLFYEAPFCYLLVNALVDGILYGTWALCVLAVSTLVDNRVLLLAGSYLFVIATHAFSKVIFPALGVTGFRFSLIDLPQGAGDIDRDPRALVAVLLIQLIFGTLLLRAREGSDAL